MKRLLIIALSLFAIETMAQDFGQDRTITIWDNSSAPHSNGVTATEVNNNDVITNITQTQLYIYEADKTKATGQSIIVIPGGGYHCVCIEWEGYKMAKWLSSQGITCGILKYRLPNGNKDVPLEDAVEAMRTMRKMSKELNIDPKKVGVMGFSAGGHLAAYTSNFAPLDERPDFAILFYPVITGDEGAGHRPSLDALLGANATEYDRAMYSLDTRVTKNTPPTLLLLSDHDVVVPPAGSARYYAALKKHGIEASMRIYPGGFHGWSMHLDFPYLEDWQSAVMDWLKKRNND